MNPGVHPITIVEIRKTATGELVSGRCRLIKAQAFLEGRYAKGESGQNAGPGGGMPDGNGPDGNEMVESYESDIASIEDGDKYGNNIVDLYNPCLLYTSPSPRDA